MHAVEYLLRIRKLLQNKSSSTTTFLLLSLGQYILQVSHAAYTETQDISRETHFFEKSITLAPHLYTGCINNHVLKTLQVKLMQYNKLRQAQIQNVTN